MDTKKTLMLTCGLLAATLMFPTASANEDCVTPEYYASGAPVRSVGIVADGTPDTYDGMDLGVAPEAHNVSPPDYVLYTGVNVTITCLQNVLCVIESGPTCLIDDE